MGYVDPSTLLGQSFPGCADRPFVWKCSFSSHSLTLLARESSLPAHCGFLSSPGGLDSVCIFLDFLRGRGASGTRMGILEIGK